MIAGQSSQVAPVAASVTADLLSHIAPRLACPILCLTCRRLFLLLVVQVRYLESLDTFDPDVAIPSLPIQLPCQRGGDLGGIAPGSAR